MKSIAVVAVTYNSSHILDGFLTKLLSAGNTDCEVVIVDSGSSDFGQTSAIALKHQVRIVRSEKNVGYGTGSNLGAEETEADWVFFVNPDVDVSLSQLKLLTDIAEQNGVTCIGPGVEDGVGRLQTTWGRTVTPPWRRRGKGWERRGDLILTETISGCCMGLQLDEFRNMKGFDERFFMFSEEMDLHKRIHDAGNVTVCALNVRVRTAGGASSEGVSYRWRQVERAVSHTKFVTKHFNPAEGVASLFYNVAKILVRDEFTPKRESYVQYMRGIGRLK